MDKFFAKFANATAHVAGTPAVFLACVVVVLVWAVSGPFFGFSETWQLVINTGTTIVTFLMVFLIQNTQNRDGAAVQMKLDELIRSIERRRRVHGNREADRQGAGSSPRALRADGQGNPGHLAEDQGRTRQAGKQVGRATAQCLRSEPSIPDIIRPRDRHGRPSVN